MMVSRTPDLWSLVRGRPEIDPDDLADAIVAQAAEEPLDYRTRLLIHDSVEALRSHWGNGVAERWLAECPFHEKIETICKADYERVGFPSIARRLMEKTDPQIVEQYFRELSRRVRKPLKLLVGGSVALLAPGMLVRHTDDIDVVDEVPREFRESPEFLDDLQKRYGLLLTHFQQHYLPSEWSSRLKFHGSYGDLEVYFVDPIDIFLGKLTSIRTKDLDDLRVLAPRLDKATITQRLKDTMQSALACADLLERAKNNWFILFGEDLPQ
ncbi:MAG: hypothetical protein HYR84_12315 [Planctomycetes bacterium]|nr:hypothetical protein [Planctomycetota bacterium]